MKTIEPVLIGAGYRGAHDYGEYALRYPHQMRFVAVAEPDAGRRGQFAGQHGIPPSRCFATWQDLLAGGMIGQAAVVATPDRMHVEPAVAALEAGYEVLLEKPMALTPAGCVTLVQAAERTGRILQVCHVMRYAPYWADAHRVLESGVLGDVMTVNHREDVEYWFMAHSYVRGTWRSAKTTSPMILAKSCHDMDLIYWNAGQRCRRLSSFGSLRHFRAQSAGPEVPERCTDGCPRAAECPYYAPRIYLTEEIKYPADAISLDHSLEARLEALKTGPYGRCVYRCDNDVVDTQVVAMEMEDGTTVTFTMHGFAHRGRRYLRVDGTLGTMIADHTTDQIVVSDHLIGRSETIRPGRIPGGHSGGDTALVDDFVQSVRTGRQQPMTSARASLESHLMAFAAEQSRLEGRVIDMDEYRRQVERLTAREKATKDDPHSAGA